ncbi:uncharacterized protein PG998_003742 [Apiospora kogelbergensis]|uniref:Uncharacterized protein n=1 Tax=Apiospora kogelbergensis TaxID=1337665 RepID=A0AAW0QKG4_9PEZI
MHLPVLSDTPLCHPNCCLSLSTPLLETLKSELYRNDVDNAGKPPVPPGLILSVGCGSGLLENLLHSHLTRGDPDVAEVLSVEGAEVATAATTIMSYLPEDRANTVPGTWALCRRAEDATALLFVYPRSVDLVKRYVDAFFARDKARTIIWLGPQADWDVFRPALEGHNGPLPEAPLKVREGSSCGVGEYEMMAVLQAPTPIP